MGVFKKFEQIDGAVNRGYARWGKWIWVALTSAIVIYGAYILWAATWGPPTGPVTLIIHSEIERPILGFSVNGVAGGNAPAKSNNPYAFDSGKSTCCGSIKGNTAYVNWTLDMTHDQYLKGMHLEERKIKMPMPRREWGENYLHVYFLTGNKVWLWWGTGVIHPKASDLLGFLDESAGGS